jgi:hypothetical protein
MAEWSMAVVLKTSDNRLYQDGSIFVGNFTPTCAESGLILYDLGDPRANTDNRSVEFRP